MLKSFKCCLTFILKPYYYICINYITLRYKAVMILLCKMVLCPQHCASFSGKWHFHSTSWGRILQISQHFCEKLESYKRYFFVSWKDSLYKVIWGFFEYFTMYPCAEEIMRVFLCFLEWNWSLHIIWGKKSHYPVHLALL